MSEREEIKWTKISSTESIAHVNSCQKNQSIYLKKWGSSDNCKHVLFLFHDLCHYSGMFKNFIEWLNQNMPDILIYSMDYVGHGQSSGTRGHFDEFEFLIQDQFNFIESVSIEANQEVIYLGHGLGGLVSIDLYNRYGNKLKHKPNKLILSNFILQLDHLLFTIQQKSKWRVKNFLKHLRLFNVYEVNLGIEQDPLIVPHPTFSSVLEIKKKTKSIYQDAYYLDIPVLISFSENDPYLNSSGMNYFIKGVKKELLTQKTYSLMKHDLYNEIDSIGYFNDIKNWIL